MSVPPVHRTRPESVTFFGFGNRAAIKIPWFRSTETTATRLQTETTTTRRFPAAERSEIRGQTPAEAVSVSDDGTVRPESVPFF